MEYYKPKGDKNKGEKGKIRNSNKKKPMSMTTFQSP